MGQETNTLSTIVGPKVACEQSLVDGHPKLRNVNIVLESSSRQPLEETKQDEPVNSEMRNNTKILDK